MATVMLNKQNNINMISRFVGKTMAIDLAAVDGLQQLTLPAQTSTENAPYQVWNGIGVIQVRGVLHKEADFFTKWLGWSDYSTLQTTLEMALADSRVDQILLDIDSPGGIANGCQDLADFIYANRQTSGGDKRISAWCSDAYSAAYALASAADMVAVNQSGGVGSIGVFVVHYEFSEAASKAGETFTPIFRGARKMDYQPYSKLSDEAATTIQNQIDQAYDLFCRGVARQRGISVEAVQATEAGIFIGQQAEQKKLADTVCTFGEFLEILRGQNNNTNEIVMPALPNATSAKAKQQVIEPSAEDQPVQTAIVPASDAVAIAELCETIGQPALAAGYIIKGMDLASVKDDVLQQQAATIQNLQSALAKTQTPKDSYYTKVVDPEVDISAHLSPATDPVKKSGLIADAEKRAA